MLHTFETCLNTLTGEKQGLLLSYMLYKLIYCYQSDLMSDSMYWPTVRMKEPLPHSWIQAIQ